MATSSNSPSNDHFLGELYYGTLRSHYGTRPSVVCLSSVTVTLLRPTQRAEIYGNIFAPSNSYGFGQFILKCWKQIPRGSR